MADRVAITSLGSLVTPATGDELIITDVSDTTDGANGTTKKITRDNLIGSTLVGLEGVTASAAELNILDGVTATASELNVLDGITATAAELNITKGGDTTNNVLNVQVKARAYLSAQQNNLPDNTATKVDFDTESYDTGGNFASGTFTAPVAGFYLVSGVVAFTSVVANSRYIASIRKNGGSASSTSVTIGNGTSNVYLSVSDILELSANDTIELYAQQASGGSSVDVLHGEFGTYLAIHLLSI